MASTNPTSPLIGWRLLALLYDFFPLLALWFFTAAAFTALHGDAVQGGWLGAAELAALWLVSGLYATVSWQRGGQTIGMRPWRLRLVADHGGALSTAALWQRYAIGSVSLLLAGIGFWWAWIDRDRLTWHDRVSGTRLQRFPKPA